MNLKIVEEILFWSSTADPSFDCYDGAQGLIAFIYTCDVYKYIAITLGQVVQYSTKKVKNQHILVVQPRWCMRR